MSISSSDTLRPLPSESDGMGAVRDSWLGVLLQITDTAYPTGVFAHSGGLEGMVQLEQVRGAGDLEKFLRENVIVGLENAQLPVMRMSYDAVCDGREGELEFLDDAAAAMVTPEELRLASARSGRQRMDLLRGVMHLDEVEPERWIRVTAGLRHCQLPVVSGMEAALLGVPLAPAMEAYAYGVVAGVLSSAMKILRLGQTTVQEILYRLVAELPALIERSRSVAFDSMGTFTPLLDIASARHKHAESRLFLS